VIKKEEGCIRTESAAGVKRQSGRSSNSLLERNKYCLSRQYSFIKTHIRFSLFKFLTPQKSNSGVLERNLKKKNWPSQNKKDYI
jgi:hypothetical protein